MKRQIVYAVVVERVGDKRIKSLAVDAVLNDCAPIPDPRMTMYQKILWGTQYIKEKHNEAR